MIWQILGITLLILVVFQIAFFSIEQLRRATYGKKVDEMELDLLKVELNYLKDLRKKKTELGGSWNGVRKFVVQKKQIESSDICSFYLYPHDKRPLPDFHPGQYLTFHLNIPGETKKLIRCYSLSDRPRPDFFRVSIKKEPHGKSSTYFHETVKEGDILDVQAPSGKFYLEPSGQSGVVLIGGGIGLTPVLSMLNYLVENGSTQPIHFFYGIRNGHEHVMKEHLENIAKETPNVTLHVCYSKPTEKCIEGKDFQHCGRVSVDLFKEVLPSNNFDYYFCGPGPMMGSLSEGLKDWGVPESHIHYETFGPSSVKKTKTRPPISTDIAVPSKQFSITFKRSDRKVLWDSSCASILELAEANDISMSSGCRAGSCGTCCTAIQKGDVEYSNEPGTDPEPGTCLACIASPKSDMVIDA